MSGPLSGIRVVDFSRVLAGPLCARTLQDLGAEVIKIEPPGAGDPYRRRAVPVPERPLNPGFILDARNKRSLALDLRSEAGRAVLYRLVRDADVYDTDAYRRGYEHGRAYLQGRTGKPQP
jgi:crotonobetainyl-CoA:carnitine CoA-transferase CaiB-like acyl-CoA transferase